MGSAQLEKEMDLKEVSIELMEEEAEETSEKQSVEVEVVLF